MKIMKEVEVSDAEVNRAIVEGMYWKAREEFYRHGNDHYDFPLFDAWRASKYNELEIYQRKPTNSL